MTQRELKREEIILKAMEIFAKRGIDGTSIKDLAEYLGTTKSYFYFYFSSKDEIIFSIQKYIMDSAISHLKRLKEMNITAAKKVEGWINWHFDALKENKTEVDFMYQAMFSKYVLKTKEKFKQEFRNMHGLYASLIADIVKEGQKRGEFRNSSDSTLLASLMVGSLFSGVKLAYLGFMDVERIREDVKKSILMMLGYEKV
ncbi:MAG: TetR/AcrR family transcriptional regulator [candidate division WOR-3 bacterium]